MQSRPVEEELTAAGIPFRLFGGQQFFDRKEVKDTAAYLRFVVNPWDEISLRRVINFPARGVGARSVQRIEEHAKARGLPFVKAVLQPQAIDGLPDGAVHALDALNALLNTARQRLKSCGALHAAARTLIEDLDLRRALDDTATGGGTGEQRYRNVARLLDWLERYEANAPRSSKSLQDFLQRVTLNGDPREQETDRNVVTLCTLHAAKGLEFGVVFLIGCVEGQLPHSRTTDPRAHEPAVADPEEERRLFYVGITRARDQLYLTATRKRMLRGKAVEVTPSRYMDGLPTEHVCNYERPESRILSNEELGSAARELLAQHRARFASTDGH
jgi:DNA helicase-2/ATP-dependent DNA helicase PcrA